jgi:hypothetical protein
MVIPQRAFNVSFWPGHDAGFLGSAWDPWVVSCDPTAPDFKIDDIALRSEVPLERLAGRRSLLDRVAKQFDSTQRGPEPVRFHQQTVQAFDLITSRRVRAAFDLGREAPAVRDRYGRNFFGQSCLLARRLVEAGVGLVQVNWYRPPGDGPSWDTHTNLEKDMKDHLMPVMDLGTTGLLEDLEQRGLLHETLVMWMGEMGREPKMSYVPPHPAKGRNHWGGVFSIALAGAGIRGGLVHGASDKNAAYAKDRPVGPQDVTATLFHVLGVPPDTEIRDRLDRPLPISRGRVLHELF